eukprot:COSAG02_NODE_26965_length_620_cov_0.859885_1_plen_150_part_10
MRSFWLLGAVGCRHHPYAQNCDSLCREAHYQCHATCLGPLVRRCVLSSQHKTQDGQVCSFVGACHRSKGLAGMDGAHARQRPQPLRDLEDYPEDAQPRRCRCCPYLAPSCDFHEPMSCTTAESAGASEARSCHVVLCEVDRVRLDARSL